MSISSSIRSSTWQVSRPSAAAKKSLEPSVLTGLVDLLAPPARWSRTIYSQARRSTVAQVVSWLRSKSSIS
nr:MAG TPA: hypothetical protein [Caudoviricetes sp.]